MKLSDLRLPDPAVEQEGVAAPAAAPTKPAEKKEKEPWGVVRSTTPSGIEWAVGIFEGEGSFVKTCRGYLSMVVQMNDETTVRRLAEEVGVGKVGGPYGPYSGGKNPSWRWVVNGTEAHLLSERMLPLLSERRKQQLLDVLATVTVPKAIQEMAKPRASKSDEPYGVVGSVTPSGIHIYYQAGPKRLYQVRTTDPHPVESNWQEVPSPSSILEVLEKGGLSWWGMKVGIQGVLDLIERGVGEGDLDYIRFLGVDGLVDLLKEHKLTVNHVKGAAADRGTNVHTALELFADTGILPDPELYPENEAGYVRGLVQFLKDCQPEVEHSELLVASTEYGYAGRFDMVAKLNGTKYASRCFPKNASRMDTLQSGGRWLLDLKTSKGVYPSYHLQCAAYEGAFEESGYGTVDSTGVVRVTADGKYELVPGVATVEDFGLVLEVSALVKRIEQEAKKK